MTMDYRLHPSRALLHPAWLASLAVLALNDHVLKGADLLPAALTGKLSDVAGLLVAPVLLAALLRVRRFGPWLFCHLAVGAGFAAIQLSSAAAAGMTALMGALGFTWVITMDPTDLLTLPVLGLSLWGFVPAMRRVPSANARRSAECGVASVGLLCCMATSSVDETHPIDEDWEEPEPPPPPAELPPIEADLHIGNATAGDQVLRIRRLRIDVALDCDAVAEAPGELLRSSMFEPATTWNLPPEANIAVLEHLPGRSPCYAAWIEADTLPATLAFWYDGTPPVQSVPAHGTSALPGELRLQRQGDQALQLTGATYLLHAPAPREPQAEGECAHQPDGQRVGWSSPVPWGSARIEAIEPGLDGCLAVDLLRAEQTTQTWYLCVPPSSFPFAVGDAVDLRIPATTGSTSGVEIVALDAQGLALDLPRVTVSAGAGLPELDDLALSTLPVYDCDLTAEADCGTVERPLGVLVSGPDLDAAELRAGDAPLRLAGTDRQVEVTVLHAQERFALDPGCALGPDSLGADLEVVVARIPDQG